VKVGVRIFFFDLFYSFVLILIFPLILIGCIFSKKFRQDVRNRFFTTFRIPYLQNSYSRIWVHAASVGEVNLAIKFIRHLQEKGCDYGFVLTTNTQTGMSIAEKEEGIASFYAPLDLSWMMSFFIQRLNLAHLILVETEVWPNMITLMAKKGKVMVINGRLSDKHFKKYEKTRFLIGAIFQQITHVFAGDPVSKERFIALGISEENVQFDGNFKFSQSGKMNYNLLRGLQKDYLIQEDDFTFVAGSIQPEEMPEILSAVRQARQNIDNFRLVVVLRHPEKREELIQYLKQEKEGFYVVSRGELPKNREDTSKIAIVDVIGVLRFWYGLADTIFVGGSLCNRGGQNMLEAVELGKPVCIGPYATNFQQESKILEEGKGLKVIQDADGLSKFLLKVARNPDYELEISKNGRDLIVQNSGALEKAGEKIRLDFEMIG
jgi:3-deoxy-D-manno-octulosonic-acid transferase